MTLKEYCKHCKKMSEKHPDVNYWWQQWVMAECEIEGKSCPYPGVIPKDVYEGVA